MKKLAFYLCTVFAVGLIGCATLPPEQACPAGTQKLPDCPPESAVADSFIEKLHEERTWAPPEKLNFDPITLGEQANVPVNAAQTKVIGPDHDDALNSLAAKIWLIENAQHTVDVMYYIFKRDLVGYSILGALCDAVKRGVDVRIMVDSLGSAHPTHSELRALQSCAKDAGFMRNAAGQVTTKKARVQAVIFNAITKAQYNRRSHDKLLIVDGHFPSKAAVMTGGRNISLDYYGIHADGSVDPTAFRDLEILVKTSGREQEADLTVGDVSEYYYSLLFLHKGNKRLWPSERPAMYDDYDQTDSYERLRAKFAQQLAYLKGLPDVRMKLETMPRFMEEGFHAAHVRLAHQLSNLTAEEVATKRKENLLANPNSINYLIAKVVSERVDKGDVSGTLRIVSPYLFTTKYNDKDGNLLYDGAQELRNLLSKFPDASVEVVTNSVLTSDNFFAQAIIDMDMAPRLLLTPELKQAWQGNLEQGELNPAVVESEEWKKLVNDPRIKIYQTGRLDSVALGGDQYYGKLHAKFIVGDLTGFIGTSNFDYRSILFNNEMGFFFENEELQQELVKIFEELKATSYRWGSPEWLEMREKLRASGGEKSLTARKQRTIFKTIRGLGLEYLM